VIRSHNIISFNPRRQHNFEQAFQLTKYFDGFKHITSIYFDPGIISAVKIFFPRFAQKIQRRSYKGLSKTNVDTFPFLELLRLYKRAVNGKIDYAYFNDAFTDLVLKKYTAPKVCIGYDGCSLTLFEKWKGKSKLVLDLCIGLPQYRLVVDNGASFKMSDLESRPLAYRNLYQQYNREIELADIVLCGSDFVKETAVFFGHEPSKFKVLNYGVEIKDFENNERTYSQKTSGLKFVFVGTVSWRKGADVLMNVWEKFNERNPGNTLHFYGSLEKEVETKKIPGLFMHGRVDRPTLIEELKTADVFVFPSTFEGSSLSIYQAMAMGLPVITTKNSGSLIIHNESGLIMEAGNKEDLFANMELLLINPVLRAKFGATACMKVQEYTWDHYGLQLKNIIQDLL
jgi:glycosyltransferase involved in cell wall biosynthesis